MGILIRNSFTLLRKYKFLGDELDRGVKLIS
ncbi:hypothetical protein Halhy_6648 (plasmid) [Haliscomenobacter hydrossis DSM 1100]|uniref:Uncharacterized protein n=1 Tax=Haliscomenobacter hydrossis (strain ATCC 27775 / DSM 1100 / LMG 10767 / O) TaxID=760192 RepID=F4L7V6_HALH1|nr:hypothetical protein Halhy_6648 [Haliscomenobacter hydrossis DSM 1100]